MHDVVIETYCVIKERSNEKRIQRVPAENTMGNESHHANNSPELFESAQGRPSFDEEASQSHPHSISARSNSSVAADGDFHSCSEGDDGSYNEEGGTRLWNQTQEAQAPSSSKDNVSNVYRISSSAMFFNFWWQDGELQGRIAVAMFHAGSALMLLSIALYVYAWFDEEYGSPVGARIGIILVGLAFIFGVLVTLCLRDQPGYDHATDRYVL